MEVATSHKASHSPSHALDANEQTQRVSALEDSLRDLTDAHRIARLGTWSWERATGAVFNSPELYAIYGIEPGQVVDLFENGEKLYAPESWQRLRVAAVQTFATGLPFELDMEILHPEAESVWVIVSGEVAEHDSAGQVAVLRGTVQEITTRKHSDQRLARSEAAALKANVKLEAVLDSMTDGLAVLDKDWRYTYFSERGAAMLGLRSQDRVGLHVWDIFPHYKETNWGKMYLQAVATGQPVHFEEYFPEPRDKWLECRAYPSDDGLSIYFTDITARKQAAEALARSHAEAASIHQTLEGVLASMTDGVNIVDTEWNYTYFNEQASRLLFVNGADMVGKNMWKMFPHSVGTTFESKMLEAVATRIATHTLDFYPEPVNKWLQCHFYPTDQGLSIYFTDVTAKLLAEESLQRTEKLATAGLLAASIAAEIKAPLDSAASLLHFSLQMELSDQVRANLLLAEHKLSRVAQATTQTLRFHRHSTTIPARADISDLMDSALALFEPRFLAAGIEVERDYVSHPRLFCYGDEVRQVFANLLSNALEATPREGTIRLRVRPAPFFGGVRVTIADDGHGIPAALQARIFELFVTSKDDATAGLGLWVSEGIMRKHKGRIAVRSSTGSATQSAGTVFSIFLPYSGVEPPSALTARRRVGDSPEP
jgi:PAS domain S-box-containing protein